MLQHVRSLTKRLETLVGGVAQSIVVDLTPGQHTRVVVYVNGRRRAELMELADIDRATERALEIADEMRGARA